jgi:hypothetical protein
MYRNAVVAEDNMPQDQEEPTDSPILDCHRRSSLLITRTISHAPSSA